MIQEKSLEQAREFRYLGHKISEYKKDMEYQLQTYNSINGILSRNFSNRYLI
jgi:hypothetical protein